MTGKLNAGMLYDEDDCALWCWRHGQGVHQCGRWCAAFEVIRAKRATMAQDDGPVIAGKAVLHCVGRAYTIIE